MSPHENLTSLFTPRHIAVIGASANSGDTGGRVLDNILRSSFPGKIFVTGEATWECSNCVPVQTIGDIPGPLDLALVCLPATDIPNALAKLATLPTRAAVIYSVGIRDLSGSMAGDMERTVKKLAEQHGIAVLGAKSAGLFRAESKLSAIDSPTIPKPGSIGFLSQSGSLTAAILDWATTKGIGFSSFVSLGDKSGLDESDILAHMADDPATSVIIGCLENIESGIRFMQQAHFATRKKPVILLRAGDTHAGSCAAAAHNGTRAGENLAYAAAMCQTGIIPAERLEEIFLMAQAFTGRPLPKGPNTVILANGGGLGILAADACEKAGLSIAKLSVHSMETLRSFLPRSSSLLNPIDVLPDADAGCILKTAEVLLEDPNTHNLLLALSPARPGVLDETAKALAKKAAACDKPIFACLMGGDAAKPGRALLTASGIPSFAFPSPATGAIAAAYRFSQWQKRPLPVEISYRHDLSKARKVVAEARKAGLSELSGIQAQALLAAFEMPLPETHLARTSDEALAAAKKTGYPAKLLLDAPGLPPEHKDSYTASALVDEAALREQFLVLTSKASRLYPEIPIRGCLVQAFPAEFKRSLSISFRRDPVFGPLLFLRPNTGEDRLKEPPICRITPLSLDDAHDLARSVQRPESAKMETILASAKGEDAYTELEDILLIMSELAMDMPEITEASCGPVFFSANQSLVSDAHFFLKHTVPHANDVPDGMGAQGKTAHCRSS